MTEASAWPSECFAFQQIGLDLDDRIRTEEQLIHMHQSKQVPEGIFYHPATNKIVSVEVKRLIGNTLPRESDREKRRTLRNRRGIMWPWTNTVQTAICKAHAEIVRAHGVQEHYVVFVVPDTLARRAYTRLLHHIRQAREACMESVTWLKPNRIHIHVVRGPTELFERF